jgi:hypothetical protein
MNATAEMQWRSPFLGDHNRVAARVPIKGTNFSQTNRITSIASPLQRREAPFGIARDKLFMLPRPFCGGDHSRSTEPALLRWLADSMLFLSGAEAGVLVDESPMAMAVV